jgi:hypothetical protein
MSAARLLVVMLAGLVLAPSALAGGGSYVFDGGSHRDRAQVRAALEASSFDWNIVPATVTIHLRQGVQPSSSRGEIWLDTDLLAAGRFGWAVVQDEYAHQVDHFLFDHGTRARLNGLLGGGDWCYGVAGLAHGNYGCERFASTLVWAYWPSADNSYRPASAADEAAAMPPAAFRSLMSQLVGAKHPAFSKRRASAR